MSEPVLPPLHYGTWDHRSPFYNSALQQREEQLLDALTRASKLEQDLIHQRQETEKAVQRVAALNEFINGIAEQRNLWHTGNISAGEFAIATAIAIRNIRPHMGSADAALAGEGGR